MSQTSPDPKITTTASKKSLETAKLTWPFIKEDYAQGHRHKAEGKPVAWSCAAVEKELYYAMGIHPYFPEQFAALCAVRRKTPEAEKEAVRFARIAEQQGYSADLCGYQRVVTGYVLNGDLSDAPLGGMAKPDLMITTSCLCDCRMKWFEDLAQRLDIPLFTLDRPEQNIKSITGTPADHEIDYYMSQLEECLKFLEDTTGNRYEPDNLQQALAWSYKTNELRQEILELRQAVPAPMGSTSGFATVYPGLYCSGTQKAHDFYKTLRDEVKSKVDKGIGEIENEKFRLLWYGIPTWYNMGLLNYFEKFGGVFAYEPNYNPLPWAPRRPEDPLKELALRSLQGGTSIASMINSLIHDCKAYNISGVVISYLITCRPYYLPALEIKRVLEKELGVPCVFIEGDLVDERLFSEGQVMTRLDAFAEQLLRKIAA